MDVSGFNAKLDEMFGKILGHALCERCYEYALLFGNAFIDLFDEIIDLPLTATNFDFWIKKTGWADNLLGWLWIMTEFVFAWGGRYVDDLINVAIKFSES